MQLPNHKNQLTRRDIDMARHGRQAARAKEALFQTRLTERWPERHADLRNYARSCGESARYWLQAALEQQSCAE